MRGTGWENLKSGALALFIGMLAAQSMIWSSTACEYGGGFVITCVAWMILVVFDEIDRQREESRHRRKRG